MRKQRAPSNLHERLRRSGAQARARASRDNDDRGSCCRSAHLTKRSFVSAAVAKPWLGRQNLVENGGCLLFVSLLSERELRDQNLTGFGEHALLTG